MSTETETKSDRPLPAKPPLDIKEVTEVLVKHYGLHEGLYDLYLEYRLGFGNVGLSQDDLLPSAVVGIYKLGVTQVSAMGPMTVDVAKANPLKTHTPKKPTPSAP